MDGELSRRAESRVAKHLRSCWSCRTRLAELEQQVHEVAQALASQTFPGPRRIDDARRKFYDRYRELDKEPIQEPNRALQLTMVRNAFPSNRAAFATGALICFVGLGMWLSLRSSTPTAADVIAGVQNFETNLYDGAVPVHQVFRVEVHEIRPQAHTRTGRLEVWSESREGRFVARWEESDGKLRYANWRGDSGTEYLYDPAVKPVAAKRPQAAIRDATLVEFFGSGANLEQLESGFLRWLATRRWQPVSFAGEVYAFSNQDGVVLQLTRARLGNGRPVFRLTAHQARGGRRAELLVEVDAETYQPRLQSVRLEADGRVVELYLHAERIEAVPRAELVDAIFEIHVPFERASVRPRADAAGSVPADVEMLPVAPKTGVHPTPSVAELSTAEMAARYALHRVRACLGEPVNVVRDPAGPVRIYGLAETLERKEQLLATLSKLQLNSLIVVDLKTVDEAMRPPLGVLPKEGQALFVEPTGSAPADETTSQITGTALSIQAQLEQYFANLATSEGSPASTADSVAEFSSETVSSSRSILAEGWALRRLAERYPPEEVRELEPQSRWLLEIMLRDHLAAIRSRTADLRSSLEPVLTSIVGRKALSRPTSERSWEAGSDQWVSLCLEVFETIERTDGLVAALFASADLPVGTNTEGALRKGVRLKLTDEAIIGLLEACSALEVRRDKLEVQVAREFSGNPDQLSLRDRPE